ncbi:MAG: hypothetical protein ACM3YE_05025 [Bacteroidota bacterium]
MKRVWILGTMVLLILSLFISAMAFAAEDPKQYYAKYLSVADVEKATGLKGITTKHDYTLHFLNPEGKEVLQVRFEKAKGWEQQTKDKKYWTEVKGIGDQAALFMPGMPQQLAFTKGPHMIVVTTFQKQGVTMFVTADQLKAVCKVIEPRLPKEDYL